MKDSSGNHKQKNSQSNSLSQSKKAKSSSESSGRSQFVRSKLDSEYNPKLRVFKHQHFTETEQDKKLKLQKKKLQQQQKISVSKAIECFKNGELIDIDWKTKTNFRKKSLANNSISLPRIRTEEPSAIEVYIEEKQAEALQSSNDDLKKQHNKKKFKLQVPQCTFENLSSNSFKAKKTISNQLTKLKWLLEPAQMQKALKKQEKASRMTNINDDKISVCSKKFNEVGFGSKAKRQSSQISATETQFEANRPQQNDLQKYISITNQDGKKRSLRQSRISSSKAVSIRVSSRILGKSQKAQKSVVGKSDRELTGMSLAQAFEDRKNNDGFLIQRSNSGQPMFLEKEIKNMTSDENQESKDTKCSKSKLSKHRSFTKNSRYENIQKQLRGQKSDSISNVSQVSQTDPLDAIKASESNKISSQQYPSPIKVTPNKKTNYDILKDPNMYKLIWRSRQMIIDYKEKLYFESLSQFEKFKFLDKKRNQKLLKQNQLCPIFQQKGKKAYERKRRNTTIQTSNRTSRSIMTKHKYSLNSKNQKMRIKTQNNISPSPEIQSSQNKLLNTKKILGQFATSPSSYHNQSSPSQFRPKNHKLSNKFDSINHEESLSPSSKMKKFGRQSYNQKESSSQKQRLQDKFRRISFVQTDIVDELAERKWQIQQQHQNAIRKRKRRSLAEIQERLIKKAKLAFLKQDLILKFQEIRECQLKNQSSATKM